MIATNHSQASRANSRIGQYDEHHNGTSSKTNGITVNNGGGSVGNNVPTTTTPTSSNNQENISNEGMQEAPHCEDSAKTLNPRATVTVGSGNKSGIENKTLGEHAIDDESDEEDEEDAEEVDGDEEEEEDDDDDDEDNNEKNGVRNNSILRRKDGIGSGSNGTRMMAETTGDHERREITTRSGGVGGGTTMPIGMGMVGNMGELSGSGSGGASGGGMGGYWRHSRPSSPRMPPPEQPEHRPKSRHENQIANITTTKYNNLGYWRARRVTFYKNGDPYFPGVEFRFKPGRDIGSLEALLDRLSLRLDLPRGARHIFSMDGDRKLNLDELEDGASYVVSSYKTFKLVIEGKCEEEK
ncbi:hypothetical protein PV327_009037 [Microctonus hyperodae]|uniref:Doublecortin domain-containing protein n=1 Tax=Microctonus hyperodae TaxID=165561 RepID=A0AA39FTK3_MICHY|nr:hypothetical protein PV327_009037 [Microctonus hyperodae]